MYLRRRQEPDLAAVAAEAGAEMVTSSNLKAALDVEIAEKLIRAFSLFRNKVPLASLEVKRQLTKLDNPLLSL